jgi:pimeloyl-ACP methyl ester carboxylesterase
MGNDRRAPVPLVLVPGLACDAALWAGALPVLQPVAQPWVPMFEHEASIGAMAEALLRTAPAARFALAGHSLGGRIALEVMRRAPQRVERLALLDTGWQPRPDDAAGEREREMRLALVDLARREGMRAMGTRWAPGMLHPERLGSPVHDAVLAMVERCGAERFAAQVQALLQRPDAQAVLDAIDCPTLVLCGREDAWSPLARHQTMVSRIRGARLVVIEHSGHMSPMEQPDAVAEALLDWLAAAGSAQPSTGAGAPRST